MPSVDAVLLPLAVGLTLLGVIVTLIAWRRGNRGRVVQGLAVALAPVALYFSGLLRLVWNAVVAVGGWASRVVFSPAVWVGLSLLALCVVLWVVGGIVARRTPRKGKPVAAGSTPAVAGKATSSPGNTKRVKPGAKSAPPVDDDMAEIEALLKNRGIN